MSTPGIVIAGTNSGCGKTTVSMGIMAALTARSLKVQPYKVGPDYIDPMFHTFITGRASRNLDSWMLKEDTVKYLYARNSKDADIAVTEGVMGFYDGFGGNSLQGSTADVSRITGTPVILVINGEAMSLSAAALVKGFVEFDKSVNVKGVIINNISGEAHYRLLKEVIEENTGTAVVGYLKNMSEISIADRHLGLVTSAEISDLKEKADMLARRISETVDLELLLKLAAEAQKIDVEPGYEQAFLGVPAGFQGDKPRARVAVARDKAFCFYYRDNLDLLEALGAELVWFSPMNDAKLPADIDGLYLGGGYPEVWAGELQQNLQMRNDIKARCEEGLPTYAECGGFMYLCESIINMDGAEIEMAGIFPGKSLMTKSLDRFGYVHLKATEDNILAKAGCEIRAHEFHYSRVEMTENIKTCFEVSKRKNGVIANAWNCGFGKNNVLAGYPHIHFWSNPVFAHGFVGSCAAYRQRAISNRFELC